MGTSPSLEQQAAHWDEWNIASDRGEDRGDPAYCRRVIGIIDECAQRNFGATGEQAAEVGCGTGWICEGLVRRFRNVWACDLSPGAIEVAKSRMPTGTFVAGDFLALAQGSLPQADLVVSCEAVAHVGDQRAFFRRCRQMTRSGGRLLLLTQNPFTWSRTRWLEPLPAGRLRHWPTQSELREHFADVGYRLESVRSIEPNGDTGLLWWRPYAQGVLRRIIGRPRAQAIFERLGLGRTLVVEAVAI